MSDGGRVACVFSVCSSRKHAVSVNELTKGTESSLQVPYSLVIFTQTKVFYFLLSVREKTTREAIRVLDIFREYDFRFVALRSVLMVLSRWFGF